MSDMVLFERPTSCQPNLFARQKNTSAIPFRSLANPFAPCSLPSLPYDVLLTIAESLDADGIHGLGMVSYLVLQALAQIYLCFYFHHADVQVAV